jgi:glucose-6-phosphate isomerase
MNKIKFDYSKALDFIHDNEIQYLESFVNSAHNMLHNRTGPGNKYLGWVDIPANYSKEELSRIKAAADKIKSDSDVLVVIGIGGSYLGARAAIEALSHSFHNMIPNSRRKAPEIYFAGKDLSPVYLRDLLDILEEKEISVNVISKSGTTTEPAIAFMIFKEYMEHKYGKEGAKSRIYATTDKQQGALKKLATNEGYETFIIPDDIGGRYSVLTAVGLLPMAVCGLKIDKMMEGSLVAYETYNNAGLKENYCYQYAAVRNILYRKNKTIEIMVNYEPSLHYFTEWWKQLYGESEGKDHKGIFPAGVDFTTDLHSMGQYIQDGLRNIFETVIYIDKPKRNLILKETCDDLDGLNYISGKDLDYINKMAMEGTIMAHSEGNVPNLIVNIPELTEYYFGQMIYFFEKACGISGYLLGVNPFDQPGVEAYKKNMFTLLGKPGYKSF